MCSCLFTVVTVGFGSPGVTVTESQGYFTMCLVKDADTIGDVTVDITDTAGTATAVDGVLILLACPVETTIVDCKTYQTELLM